MTADQTRPNIVIILADDLGFSDIGAYGSEIATPHLDALAAGGVRMSQFYNTARCSPSRASLLTGLHPHQTGIGVLTHDDGPNGYPGTMSQDCATIPEVLRDAGYHTAMSGKWHLTGHVDAPDDSWPTRRGFDDFYGILAGAGSYYGPITLTDQEAPAEPEGDDWYFTSELGERAATMITRHHASAPAQPVMLYLAFTAPHWPLHAPSAAVAKYRGRYDTGWDDLRAERLQRQIDSGLLAEGTPLTERDARVPAWDETADRDWQAQRMEVYAAQVELLDAAVGRVVAALDETGRLENTLIMFLSDNGGACEEFNPDAEFRATHTPETTRDGRPVRVGNTPAIVPGPADTYTSYGRPWANVSNTPFRLYKSWVHEGGLASPMIAYWPGHLEAGSLCRQTHFLPDVMATVCEVAGADYPSERAGLPVPASDGVSMINSWRGGEPPERTLCWEHVGNAAVRRGRWKLVREFRKDWELYDLSVDRVELHDVAGDHQELVAELADHYQRWADRCGVKPREQVLAAVRGRPVMVANIDSAHRIGA